MNTGEKVFQSVVIGASEGIYSTTIQARQNVSSTLRPGYQALKVSPDKTVFGDSGSPLYLDDKVYGINNAGNGIYGVFSDQEAIYAQIDRLTAQLNPSQVPEPEISLNGIEIYGTSDLEDFANVLPLSTAPDP